MLGITQRLRLLLAVCVVILAFVLPLQGMAAETEDEAEEISSQQVISESEGFTNHRYLFDKNRRTGYLTSPKASLTLCHEQGIGSVYLTFFLPMVRIIL